MMDLSEKKIDLALSYLAKAQHTDYIGEPVSQLQHALQCAYFAKQSGHSKEVILASLFHDIGHFASNTIQPHMADLGIIYHEWIGSYLMYELGFSAKIALLIGYHVDAKRYLAAQKTNYMSRLSQASKNTLNFQGGVMSVLDREHFAKLPLFKEILQVRINDEKAKELDLKVPELDAYRTLMKECIRTPSEQKIKSSSRGTVAKLLNNILGFITGKET
jgi:predicted HD phosphohydrolase